eukprot:gnl/MRDRNA2_/MRDRNA2_120834_c0_seq1.p1 gnl/MRDRNA2_/MRDRNA2_120834_c0~~gnl/MRDRNA2_/MRDRNA2_120834_c0_seq1.p1  ORF type:complete len:192 (-),score=18.85 gnl/MRDRNA2_/MRDRNA2_120834_c0_seq1:8-583(-)
MAGRWRSGPAYDDTTPTILLDSSQLRAELCGPHGDHSPVFFDKKEENRTRHAWLRDNYKRPATDIEVMELGRSHPKMVPALNATHSPWERERSAAFPSGSGTSWRRMYGCQAHEVKTEHAGTKHVFSSGANPPKPPPGTEHLSRPISARLGRSCPPAPRPDEDLLKSARYRNTTSTYRKDRHYYFLDRPFM